MSLASSLAQLSLRARIALLVAVAVAAAVALTSAAAFLTVRHELTRQLDSNLLERARTAAASPLGNLDYLLTVPPAALNLGDVSVALVDEHGTQRSVGGDPPQVGAPERAVARGLVPASVRGIGRSRVAAVQVQPGVALVLSQSTRQSESTLRTLGVVMLGVGVAGIAVAALVGLAVAQAGVRPVERLTGAAEHVARTGQLDPIEVHGGDELARLAASFNTMLAALGGARVRERQLVADAGHELRTPLTSLRTNLDLLAQSDAAEPGSGLAAGDRQELLSDVRAQLRELSGLVDDLVELSREGTPGIQHAPVDLAAVIRHAVERMRLRYPELVWDVRTEPWTVVGDGAMLERAVTNLVDNAAKWSPSAATVAVSLRDGLLEVADEGPGIAPRDLPHVFDRFYRSAEARALPGSGLGLSIVARAAAQHGGSVSAGRAPAGGALLALRLPGAPTAPEPSRRDSDSGRLESGRLDSGRPDS